MATQAKSGFSTEGTQYSVNSSYYLLDTVPGPGDVLEGPITITGNLTTTGTTVSQGNLAAPGVVTNSVTSSSNLSLSAPTGTVTVAGDPASGYNLTVNASGAVLNGPGGKSVGINPTNGAFINNGALPVVFTSPVKCSSYLNPNATTSSVTRTAPSAIGLSPFNTLKIDDVNSAPITLPVTSLFTGGCVPKLAKITITTLAFGNSFVGSCSPSAPFSLYFYQGSSTSWDVISNKSVATFTYTNQTGSINAGGQAVIPSVELIIDNVSLIDPAGGPLQIWYYSNFQGFFGAPSGTQATFTLSVVL